jgi:hypothetical protein
MLSASDLATALLNKPLTEARLLKLRRHLARDPWASQQIIDSAKVSALLDALDQHPAGGENTRAFVHDAIVNQPQRTLPALPDDIAKKLEAYQQERERRAEGQR